MCSWPFIAVSYRPTAQIKLFQLSVLSESSLTKLRLDKCRPAHTLLILSFNLQVTSRKYLLTPVPSYPDFYIISLVKQQQGRAAKNGRDWGKSDALRGFTVARYARKILNPFHNRGAVSMTVCVIRLPISKLIGPSKANNLHTGPETVGLHKINYKTIKIISIMKQLTSELHSSSKQNSAQFAATVFQLARTSFDVLKLIPVENYNLIKCLAVSYNDVTTHVTSRVNSATF